jgi:hypothetical protein
MIEKYKKTIFINLFIKIFTLDGIPFYLMLDITSKFRTTGMLYL